MNMYKVGLDCKALKRKRIREYIEDELCGMCKNVKLDYSNVDDNAKVFDKRVLYKHSSLRVKYTKDKDSYSMYTTEFIPVGTLIAIEKGYIGSIEYLSTLVKNNPKISKELYPRSLKSYDNVNIGYDLYPESEKKWLSKQKILHNIWDYSDKEDNDPLNIVGTNILCPFLAKINHNCMPNSFVVKIVLSDLKKEVLTSKQECSIQVDNFSDEFDIDYEGAFAIFATKDIEAGSEILTSYSYEVGHNNCEYFRWKCDCGLDLKERKKIFNFNVKFAKHMWNKEKDYIKTYILNKYLI